MSEPFLGEIKYVSFNFPPKGWAQCNGQLLPIAQNQPLFSLLGVMYGGDGRTNFALPNLQDRIPMHVGGNHITQGERGGEVAHTLTQGEGPMHSHLAQATNTVGDQYIPTGNMLANVAANVYAPYGPMQPLLPASVSNMGGSQPHENRSPYLTLMACIALVGIFPSRN